MKQSIIKFERAINCLALVIALVVALGIPIGYFYISYHDIVDAIDFKAKVKASALSGLIASNPDLWVFAENRLQGLISREPVPLGNEVVQVINKDNEVITQVGSMPSGPVLQKYYPLYDADRIVGQIVVSGALSTLIRDAQIYVLLSFGLGLSIYVVMKVLPLRALDRAMDALYAEKERVEKTLYSIGDAIVTTDAVGHINFLNPAAERLLGHSAQEVRGRQVAEVIHLQDVNSGGAMESSLYRALRTKAIASCQGNSELRRSDGTVVAIEERASPITDRKGGISGGVVVLRDVRVAREYLKRRSWEATHDALTGLFNRREFENRVQRALTDAQQTGHFHVLCYMDLDHFKLVNDSCGHLAGDALLIQLSQLIQLRIRESDTLARLGGDEFGLLLEDCDDKRGQLIATEIMSAVKNYHFHWESKVATVGVSIGLTMITKDHTSVAEVVGEADCACYWAKEQGENRVLLFVPDNINLVSRRSEAGWVGRINDALNTNRFVLFQQTYKTLHRMAIHNEHLEILLRMLGDDGELILPECFLPAAERYKLMPEIDRWVIHEVFSRYDAFIAQRGGKTLTCSINLSGASINSDGFFEFIRKQAQQYEIKPGTICFELTETVTINNLQTAVDFIRGCKAIGFLIALDDFGVGTSSFGYLKNIPADYLKIDGSFIKNIERDRVDRTMVETINRVGHLLGKLTIAESAENEAIVEILDAIGVDFAQGCGVSPPIPLFAPVPGAADQSIGLVMSICG